MDSIWNFVICSFSTANAAFVGSGFVHAWLVALSSRFDVPFASQCHNRSKRSHSKMQRGMGLYKTLLSLQCGTKNFLHHRDKRRRSFWGPRIYKRTEFFFFADWIHFALSWTHFNPFCSTLQASLSWLKSSLGIVTNSLSNPIPPELDSLAFHSMKSLST